MHLEKIGNFDFGGPNRRVSGICIPHIYVFPAPRTHIYILLQNRFLELQKWVLEWPPTVGKPACAGFLGANPGLWAPWGRLGPTAPTAPWGVGRAQGPILAKIPFFRFSSKIIFWNSKNGFWNGPLLWPNAPAGGSEGPSRAFGRRGAVRAPRRQPRRRLLVGPKGPFWPKPGFFGFLPKSIFGTPKTSFGNGPLLWVNAPVGASVGPTWVFGRRGAV